MNYKRGFIEIVAVVALALGLLAASGVAYLSTHQTSAPIQSFGSTFNPTAGSSYRLQSSVSSTQNTVTLTSFKEPVSNIPYTMSYLNSSIEYGTIDPQNNTSKEFISFTGITQNADGTALLTGVTRGLGFSYPYTASTTLAQSHSGQAIFILSNPPQLTNQYLNMTNGGTVTGLTTFTDPPIVTNSATSTNQLASVAYVNGIAFGSSIVPASLGGTGNASNPLNMILIGNGGGAITSTSSPTVGYITATSTTGTSNFAGNLTIGGNSTTTGSEIVASSTIYSLNVGSVNATSTILLNGVSFASPATTTTFLTTGANTWTKPVGAKMVLIEAWGAGGGSGGAGGGHDSPGAGGGGYMFRWIQASSLGSTETATVGTGGAAGTAGDNPGNVGGNSTFGSWLTAYGGAAGIAGGTGYPLNGSAGGGEGGVVFSGAPASTSGTPATVDYGGGAGGSITTGPTAQVGGGSIYGGGGGGGGDQSNPRNGGTSTFGGGNGGAGGAAASGSNGTQPGGGGGGSSASSPNRAGAKGGDGEIKVTTFF